MLNASDATSSIRSSNSSSSSSSHAGPDHQHPGAQPQTRHTGVLVPALAAAARRATDPAYLARLKHAAAAPVNIAVMTSLFWQLPVHGTDGCSVDGVPLDCHIQNGGTEVSVLLGLSAAFNGCNCSLNTHVVAAGVSEQGRRALLSCGCAPGAFYMGLPVAGVNMLTRLLLPRCRCRHLLASRAPRHFCTS
jgi:hypothetical protein